MTHKQRNGMCPQQQQTCIQFHIVLMRSSLSAHRLVDIDHRRFGRLAVERLSVCGEFTGSC